MNPLPKPPCSTAEQAGDPDPIQDDAERRREAASE